MSESNRIETLMDQVDNELKAARRQYAETLAYGEARFLNRENYAETKGYWSGTVDALRWSLDVVNKQCGNNPQAETIRALQAEVERLTKEREMYRQAFGEIQATSIMGSSNSAWRQCLEIAAAATNDEFVYPNSDKLAGMKQERDNATELLRAWADFDWTQPRSFKEWQELVYSLILHLQQYAPKEALQPIEGSQNGE